MNLCTVQSCSKPVESKGLCHSHYNAQWIARKRQNTPGYSAYYDMKQRCLNPNNKFYYRYGGRGIKICNRWLESFDNFIKDVGAKPSPEYSIDRIDNDGDYEPSNVRWASARTQSHNRITRIGASGERNIGWNKFSSKWLVRIYKDHKLVFSGRYIELADAIVARDAARKEFYP